MSTSRTNKSVQFEDAASVAPSEASISIGQLPNLHGSRRSMGGSEITISKPNRGIASMRQGFQSLKEAPRELWVAYLIKFLDAYAYFSLSIIITLFLTEDFGFSDLEAGILYGAWGGAISIYGMLCGSIVDRWGVAKSLKVGQAISLFARISMFFTVSKSWMVVHMIFTLPLGNLFGIPVLAISIRRYTNTFNRGFAFGVFYIVQNIAGLIAGPIVDAYSLWLAPIDEQNPSIPGEWRLSSHRTIVLAGIAANLVAFMLSLLLREIKVVDQPDPEFAVSPQEPCVVPFQPYQSGMCQLCGDVRRSKNFWRFLTVCLCTLNVRMIFRHLDATFPKYLQREFGNNVPYGTIYSINPTVVILLVPMLTAVTTNIDPLKMITVGSLVSALSVFFLVANTSILASIMFVIVLSIGEAIWSPRLYDYTMSICHQGKEATFMAFAAMPMFLAKLPVGLVSGILLEQYCPAHGERDSQHMWLIIAGMTLSSPVLLVLLWKCHQDTHENDVDFERSQRDMLHDSLRTDTTQGFSKSFRTFTSSWAKSKRSMFDGSFRSQGSGSSSFNHSMRSSNTEESRLSASIRSSSRRIDASFRSSRSENSSSSTGRSRNRNSSAKRNTSSRRGFSSTLQGVDERFEASFHSRSSAVPRAPVHNVDMFSTLSSRAEEYNLGESFRSHNSSRSHGATSSYQEYYSDADVPIHEEDHHDDLSESVVQRALDTFDRPPPSAEWDEEQSGRGGGFRDVDLGASYRSNLSSTSGGFGNSVVNLFASLAWSGEASTERQELTQSFRQDRDSLGASFRSSGSSLMSPTQDQLGASFRSISSYIGSLPSSGEPNLEAVQLSSSIRSDGGGSDDNIQDNLDVSHRSEGSSRSRRSVSSVD